MESKRAVVVCDFSVSVHPSAENATLLAKILKEIGYETVLIGFDPDVSEDNVFVRHGVECRNISTYVDLNSFVLKRVIERRRLVSSVIRKQLSEIEEVNVIIYFGDTCKQLFKALKKKAKNDNAQLICHVCEWYDKEKIYCVANSFADKIRATSRYISNQKARKSEFIKNKKIIAVSNTLKEYFEQQGCNCIRIPNIMSIESTEIIESTNEKLIMGYFGSPGPHNVKDSLKNIILGINLLNDEELSKLEFHVYGVKAEDYMLYDIPHEVIERLRLVVFFHGRVPQETVRQEIRSVDYTALLRSNTFSNNCGLSSKMEESLAAGIPMICNLTSDMDLYVKDSFNGLICCDETPEQFVIALRKALTIGRDDHYRIKKNAYEVAKNNFDYQNYIRPLKEFIDSL